MARRLCSGICSISTGFRPGEDERPVKIELTLRSDADLPDDVLRRKFNKADEVPSRTTDWRSRSLPVVMFG